MAGNDLNSWEEQEMEKYWRTSSSPFLALSS